MLLLLVLVMLVVLLVNVMNLGIVCSESSRFERSAAALLLIATDAKRVHRFKARLVGIAIV